MENKDKNIEFSIKNINTEQFALFEENRFDNGKINLETNLSYGLNVVERDFIISIKFTFEMKKKPFMSIQVNCNFEIGLESFNDLITDNKIIVPNWFIAHMAMITVGTSRGILHSKTEGTIFNKYILPTINVAQMIPEDAIFDN
jgi:hypothetical protein